MTFAEARAFLFEARDELEAIRPQARPESGTAHSDVMEAWEVAKRRFQAACRNYVAAEAAPKT